MNRFALNFICKNESHIITSMLDSARPVTDLIVALDTGSTDNTIALIRSYGEKYNIPTYVFERPFDDFGASRNHALDRLRLLVEELKWDKASVWAFRMDCDEKLEFTAEVIKERISADLYFARLRLKDYMNNSKTRRPFFFRLSRNFAWEGPVHERLIYDHQDLTSGDINEVTIIREPTGASWKGNLEEKYLGYIAKFKTWIDQGHRSFLWLNYIANTYVEASEYCPDKDRQKQYLLQAKGYYEEITNMELERRQERYMAFRGLAATKSLLGEERAKVREAYLQAHIQDKKQVEPIFVIIQDYIQSRNWAIAYLYSSFAMAQYHNNKSNHDDVSEYEEDIYDWDLLRCHTMICIYSGKLAEGRTALLDLNQILHEKILELSRQQRVLIQSTIFRLKIYLTKRWIQKWCKRPPRLQPRSNKFYKIIMTGSG